MNYLCLNTNLELKLQGKCWKDDVVAFTAHLSVTIKRLKQKVVLAPMLEGQEQLPSTMVANANHTMKNVWLINFLATQLQYCLERAEIAQIAQGNVLF